MTRNTLGLAAAAVSCVVGLGASQANADHYRRSCGSYGGYVSYSPSYYQPAYAPVYSSPGYSRPVVYSAPVVYSPAVSYATPVPYYRPVTYVQRPVYYPPVRVVRPVYAPVRYGYGAHHRTYGGFVGSRGVGFSYGSRHRGFSFSVGD